MSCWNKEQLEQMMEDVVNVLDMSDAAIAEHGQHGTPPAELVRMVLQEKDRIIRNLRDGMVDCMHHIQICNDECQLYLGYAMRTNDLRCLVGRVPIRWRCEHCNRKHFWWWQKHDVMSGPILMECERCRQMTRLFMERDGLHAPNNQLCDKEENK